ncbi:MAG: hypothetical protein MI747_00520 [Desulfobacterales bacterium]|nr:hypothetical protein [Desulfobacterales bacterium]
MNRQQRQRLLQIGMGLGLLVLAFLVEMVAVPPDGIHIYGPGSKGPKGLIPGFSREESLAAVNGIKSIRILESCAPHSDISLTSREPFAMTPELARARAWICRSRKGSPMHLIFQEDRLAQVIVLRTGWGKADDIAFMESCFPGIGTVNFDPALYLEAQDAYPLFYH